MIITDINELDQNGYYTYGDYLLWQFKERVELFRGKLRQMAAPNVRHQRIASNIHGSIWMILQQEPCDVFSAPFDVRLSLPPQRSTSEKTDTVVQPDICVVCDRSKLDERGCIGAPELVVEILSPGNSKREMKDKLDLYESAGVLEYWVIDPEHSIVHAYTLDQNTRQFIAARPLTDEDILRSSVLANYATPLDKIFAP